MTPAMRLTAQGNRALAAALTGLELKFTRVGLGSGSFDYDTESVYNLTALKKFEMWLPLTQIKILGNDMIDLEAYLSNAELTKGFAAREHGLYCLSPESGEEILYSYRNVGEEYDFIPANTGSALKNIYVEYECEIDDAENVTAVLDASVAFMLRDEFNEHVAAERPHPNAPCKMDDVQSTTALWATDNDSHLHKISVENLKEVLRDESDALKIVKVLELGLMANVLAVEDFAGESVTDKFAAKVTSSTANSNLIGVESVAGLRQGSNYVITDGVNAESVQIAAVLRDGGGYRCKLQNALANSYNCETTFLYKTTPEPCNKKTVTYTPPGKFTGVAANVVRTVELEIYFEIQGDGFFDGGYFTLA